MSEERNISNENPPPGQGMGKRHPEGHRAPNSKQDKMEQEGQVLQDPETISQPQTETSNMETHAEHLHKAPGHGWTHYLFEFFMLFLAITLGFFVENIREHRVERTREKQFMKSLIADLGNDTLILREHISHLKKGIAMMDSMIVMLNAPAQLATSSDQLYYWGRVAPRLRTLSINTRTFEQLKNSGGFRLVNDINTSNKIMTYYERLPLMKQLEEIYQGEFEDYKKVAAKIFSPVVFRAMEASNGEIIRTTNNALVPSGDNELIRELSVFSIYMNGSRRGILYLEEDLAKKANELIEYLDEEYHLHE